MNRLSIKPGDRFGRWAVVELCAERSRDGRKQWLCRCDCGKEVVVSDGNLKTHGTKSCGCLRNEVTSRRVLVDEVGNRYGRLRVMERNGIGFQGARWLCVCDCGKQVTVSGSLLRQGKSKSCGCLRDELVSSQFKHDAMGKRYGRLLVVGKCGGFGPNRRYWVCKCDCGETVEVLDRNLRSGNNRSCGCLHSETARELNFRDETGKRYGRLVVLRQHVPRQGSKKYCRHRNSARNGEDQFYSMWECRCDCGETTIVEGKSLRLGHTQSCGCWGIEKKSKPTGHAPFVALYDNYRKNASNRGLEWNLTEDQVREITKRNCFYCGIEPKQKRYARSASRENFYVYNGIDRVDNNKGYIPDNVVACCIHCNRAKRTRTLNEFVAWAERLHENLSNKGIIDTKGAEVLRVENLSVMKEVV